MKFEVNFLSHTFGTVFFKFSGWGFQEMSENSHFFFERILYAAAHDIIWHLEMCLGQVVSLEAC